MASPHPIPDCLPPPATQRPPRERLPAGSVDAHVHIIGATDRYPLDARRNYTPHVCTLADYRELMDRLGIDRAVLVQPSLYGTDNRALLDALAEGGDTLRGVVVPAPDIGDDALRAMHRAGVRGIRLNLISPQMLSVDDGVALARRVADWGWHLQLHVALGGEGLQALLDVAERTTLPLVVDHLGRVAPQRMPAELIELLRAGRCWVKLSAPYRVSAVPFPHEDLQPLLRMLLGANPDRLVWGSDWPHTEQQVTVPQAADLAGLLARWVPSEALRRRILVDNPARLYDWRDA
jgi:predicted TIM-barrel fold metal-dependent hydrolase